MKWVTYEPNRHLSPSEIYPPAQECPICGYTGGRDPRRIIQKAPEIWLLCCPRCFGLSASHMPTRELLDQLYTSYYQHSGQERVIFQKPSRLARHIVSITDIKPNSVGAIRVMDFGGGDGSISRWAGELISRRMVQLVEVQVVDYIGGKASQSGSVKIEFVRHLKDAHADCDLIIASGVFEHIPDLGSVLKEIFSKLRPGGFFYARTAYNLPLMTIFGLDMNYPGHVHDLGDKFWGNLPNWFAVPVEIVRSRPGIVETQFRQDFIRTLAAYCLKLPARIECLWTRHPICKLYGGWEVVMQRNS